MTEERFRTLTDSDLATLRYLLANRRDVPSDLAARLLDNRDLWVERAQSALAREEST